MPPLPVPRVIRTAVAGAATGLAFASATTAGVLGTAMGTAIPQTAPHRAGGPPHGPRHGGRGSRARVPQDTWLFACVRQVELLAPGITVPQSRGPPRRSTTSYQARPPQRGGYDQAQVGSLAHQGTRRSLARQTLSHLACLPACLERERRTLVSERRLSTVPRPNLNAAQRAVQDELAFNAAGLECVERKADSNDLYNSLQANSTKLAAAAEARERARVSAALFERPKAERAERVAAGRSR
jgi:hypothetical protein